MQTYTILTPRNDSYSVTIDADEVIEASPTMDWALGLPFEHVRTWCERKGYRVVPLVEQPDKAEFDFQGSTYRVHFRHGRAELVTKDGEAVQWADLPIEIRRLV